MNTSEESNKFTLSKTNQIILSIIAVLLMANLFLPISSFELNYIQFADWLFPGSPDKKGKLLQIILNIGAGLAVLAGLYLSYIRAKSTQEAVEQQTKTLIQQGITLDLNISSQLQERFKTAIEHIADEKPAIVLGGIVELKSLANDQKDDYEEIVFDILCSFLRTKSDNKARDQSTTTTVQIQSLIDVIFNEQFSHLNADLHGCDLSDVKLEGKIISRSNFTGCEFTGLSNVIFKDCRFDHARVAGSVFNCEFISCNLFDFNFDHSLLSKVTFEGGNMDYLKFRFADLLSCKFNNMPWARGDFFYSSLHDVTFENANCSGSDQTTSLVTCNK